MSLAYDVSPRRDERSRRWSERDRTDYVQTFESTPASRFVHASHTWGSNSAVAFARHALDQLERDLEIVGEVGIAPVARGVMSGVLRECLANDSVYPAIADDADGGLAADWRANLRRISIEVDAEGDLLFSVHGEKGQLLYRGTSLTQLRRHLRDFTAYVNSVNPSWRSLFKSGRPRRSEL